MKRVFAILMALCMIAALVGCSGATASSQSTASAGAQSVAGSSSATSEATTEFDPDKADGIDFSEMRAEFGAMPTLEDGTTVGCVIKQLQNNFWQSLKTGYEDAGKTIAEGEGIALTVDAQAAQDESDEEGQLTIMNNMINKKYNAILFSPISDSNLFSGVETAVEEGITTVNVNDGVCQNTPYFVGPNAYQNGVLAAQWIAEKLNNEGQVAIVVGKVSAYAARERTAGFKEWMAENAPNIEIVAEQSADWDRQTAKELTETWLTQYPDLKAIFSNNDDMALGVVEAVRAAEKEGGEHIYVVGVDGNAEAYDSIRAGGQDATIDSFPYYMGQASLECTLRIMAGQELPKVVWTPQALIDSTNVDEDAATVIGWEDVSFS